MKSRKKKLMPLIHCIWQLTSSNSLSSQQMYYIGNSAFSLSFLWKLKRFNEHPLFDKYEGLKEVVQAL